MSRETDFIEKIAPIIQKEAKKRGYKFPSAIIGQAVLESGGGTSALASYHNYFGLKCGSYWKGASVNMKTKEEYTPGTMTTISDNFRAYSSMEEGVKGYFDFISTKRYENLKTAKSPLEYLDLIKKDGYATAQSYVNGVYSVINYYGLEFYDTQKASNKPAKNKGIDDIAKEVISGKWGNGEVRRVKLEEAGYNYNTIQKRVNEMLRGR